MALPSGRLPKKNAGSADKGGRWSRVPWPVAPGEPEPGGMRDQRWERVHRRPESVGATSGAAGVKQGLLDWGARHQDRVRDQGPFLEVGGAGLLWLRRNRGTLKRALRCHTGRAGARSPH